MCTCDVRTRVKGMCLTYIFFFWNPPFFFVFHFICSDPCFDLTFSITNQFVFTAAGANGAWSLVCCQLPIRCGIHLNNWVAQASVSPGGEPTYRSVLAPLRPVAGSSLSGPPVVAVILPAAILTMECFSIVTIMTSTLRPNSPSFHWAQTNAIDCYCVIAFDFIVVTAANLSSISPGIYCLPKCIFYFILFFFFFLLYIICCDFTNLSITPFFTALIAAALNYCSPGIYSICTPRPLASGAYATVRSLNINQHFFMLRSFKHAPTIFSQYVELPVSSSLSLPLRMNGKSSLYFAILSSSSLFLSLLTVSPTLLIIIFMYALVAAFRGAIT